MKPPMGWDWPPRDPALGKALAAYYDKGSPLSIQGADGVLGECEAEWRRRLGVDHALLCSSGTMALYSAYFAAGIHPGDEVICPTVTYHATATPALHLGAKVILVDVCPNTGNIDPDALLATISPRTKVVATNAMWGHPVKQDAIRDICNRHGLLWIEDFSHAHFSSYKGRMVGTWGDMACASLQGQKFISGGEGGLFITKSSDLMDRAVLLGHNLKRSLVDVRNENFRPLARTGYGLKLRIHPLAALIILHQLQHHADRWLKERHDSLSRLSNSLNDLPGLSPPIINPDVTSMGAWYGYKPQVDEQRLGKRVEDIVSALRGYGLDAGIPGAPPLHNLALFDPHRFPINSFKKSEQSNTFPGADLYRRGRISLDTPTGKRDEPLLQFMVSTFNRVWDDLGLMNR